MKRITLLERSDNKRRMANKERSFKEARALSLEKWHKIRDAIRIVTNAATDNCGLCVRCAETHDYDCFYCEAYPICRGGNHVWHPYNVKAALENILPKVNRIIFALDRLEEQEKK